ncbi:hypothetical protein BSL78_22995 [Apostichopus japonicus]|uniref:Uncharacterized protein n=1 Tax=Stichopus japonicus TaxID=307972 RepID=A0A2G8JWM0_STIJA|nr:hypothetical protein BSL78_22995 [Apostichopus japonicus]
MECQELLQSANIACSRLGSVLEDVLNQLGQPGIVGTVCESFEKGNVDEACGRVWDLATNGDAGSISVIHRLYCRERDEDNEIYNYKYNGSEIEKELLRKVESYDLYDPCSETGIKKANSFVFALMDWLGPDAYVSVNRGEIDPNSACDILRYLLSLDTAEYIVQFSSILSYPVADILESFQTFDICAISQIDFDRIIAIRASKEILVEYSGLKGIEFCDFIAKPQTREAYLELGATIVRNAFHTLVDEETCNDVLTIIAPLDKEDLLEIEGASNHAEKIIDGLAIYCRVFEEFLSAVVEKDKLDVKRLCHSFQSRDTAGIEDICLSFSYPDRVLTGLRPFDFIPVFIYIARELFGFADDNCGELRSNILDIFTDVERCSEAVDKIVNLISHIDLEEDLTIYQLTGYQSSEDFCQTIADAFNTEMTESTPANDELSGTYNIFAKIAIYIQRVARSV